ncbi:hypothetical protein HK104_003587, partial [Borealophlyctis nickersoniae]
MATVSTATFPDQSFPAPVPSGGNSTSTFHSSHLIYHSAGVPHSYQQPPEHYQHTTQYDPYYQQQQPPLHPSQFHDQHPEQYTVSHAYPSPVVYDNNAYPTSVYPSQQQQHLQHQELRRTQSHQHSAIVMQNEVYDVSVASGWETRHTERDWYEMTQGGGGSDGMGNDSLPAAIACFDGSDGGHSGAVSTISNKIDFFPEGNTGGAGGGYGAGGRGAGDDMARRMMYSGELIHAVPLEAAAGMDLEATADDRVGDGMMMSFEQSSRRIEMRSGAVGGLVGIAEGEGGGASGGGMQHFDEAKTGNDGADFGGSVQRHYAPQCMESQMSSHYFGYQIPHSVVGGHDSPGYAYSVASSDAGDSSSSYPSSIDALGYAASQLSVDESVPSIVEMSMVRKRAASMGSASRRPVMPFVPQVTPSMGLHGGESLLGGDFASSIASGRDAVSSQPRAITGRPRAHTLPGSWAPPDLSPPKDCDMRPAGESSQSEAQPLQQQQQQIKLQQQPHQRTRRKASFSSTLSPNTTTRSEAPYRLPNRSGT